MNRSYDSSAANVYDKELSFGLICYCVLYYDATRYTETYNTNNGVTTRSYIDDGRFMMDYNHVSDSYTMSNSYYAVRWWNYIIRRAGQVAFANNWSQPDSNGIQTRTIQEIKINHNSSLETRYLDAGNGPIISWTDVATNKPYQEQLYPLGAGWTWDIPYIKTEFGDKKFLNMGSKGTYEMVNNTLKGYPWKDLTVLTDTTVVVERSNVAIKSLDGIYQHFATDGRLIQISDAYNNTIQFKYSQHAKYGKVLTSITDAINNSITIAYSETSITLTQGDKVVRYDKSTQYRGNPRPPFETLSNEYLTQVTDPLGRVTRFNYEERNAKYSTTGAVPTEPNPLLLLTQIKYPTGASTNYTYESAVTNRLLGESASEQVYRMQSRKDVGNNREFNKLDFTYLGDIGSSSQNNYNFGTTIQNGLKNTTFNYRKVYVGISPTVYTNSIVETIGDESRTTTFQYDEARRITNPIVTTNTFSKAGTNATPTIERVSYDDYGNVLSQTNPLNVTTTFSYHPTTHLLAASTERVDANQTRNTTYERNAQGKVTAIIVTNQAGTKLAHSKFEQIDSYGNIGKTTILDDDRNIEYVMEYGYSGAFPTKQTVQVTNADGQPSTIENKLEYDSSTGWVTSFTNGNHEPGNNHITTYQYDKLGRLTKVTNPDQSTMNASYNDVTNQVTVVDETGVTSIQKWDQLGHKMEEGIMDGGYRVVKQYDYDAWSRPLWEQNGSGHRTSYLHDAWNRVTRTTLPNGAYTTMGYDELNRTTTSTDPLGVQSRTTVDLLGREILSQINKGAGFQQLSSTQYDDMGNITFSTDAQHTTKYQYDALGRLTSVTDPKNDTTSYTYSLAGFLKEIRYPDATTTQKRYDQLGRLVRQTDTLGQFEKMYYDKNSNLVTTVDQKGQVFHYQYNNRNFLTAKSGPNDGVGYTYDLSGRRKSMADSTGSTNYVYKNTTGELVEVQFPDTKKISYTYNQLGLRDTMTGPFGQVNVYTYDNLNRLKTVGPSMTVFEAEYDYYNNNLLKEIKQRNGNKSTFTYDGYSINTLIHTKANGSEINYFDYDYDGNGNITGQTSRQNGPFAAYGYSYDSLNRIATSSQFNETYTYNNRGNRVALQSDRIPDISPTEETNYTYDAWNRLTGVTKSGGGQVSYRYNGDGLLYERTENNTTVRYYYDGDQVIAEGNVVNGTVTMKAEYTRGKGLIARQDASDKQYYLHNGHGDVVELRNSTGEVSLNRYTYDMWGSPLTTVESVANPFRYSGELWDQSAGLQYLRARWYDPSVGRFISKDTYEGQIDNPLTMNLYTYVHNNPLKYTDPTGHLICMPGMESCSAPSFKGVIDFVLLDDLNTISSSETTYVEKGLALVSLTPYGKLAKGGKVIIKAGSEAWQYIKSLFKGCNCFTAGTKVLTDEGEKNIEDIEVGDKVLAKDENNPDGELAYKEVTALYRNQRDDIIKLHVGEQVIETTENHPFWVEGKGWVFADELQVGDKLQKADGSNLTIDKVEFVKLDEPVMVYNFTVADYHTYYVTDIGIWVHNTQCGVFSAINKDKRLVRAAEEMGKDATIQKEADELIAKFLKGNTNPGLGSKNLFGNINYLRGRNGARVFYRMNDGKMEILGKSNKANEQTVINAITDLYK
ncbi:hypothetical protein PAECIP111893_04275 [Paenibacillus plantiphilus]|uniref:Hint domain-containing protein n=1 Tax=Paenibacillus plantiphilus TaxID=2905650 RepID=A0ABN8GT06_9BACL|nr:polymorphic toxin-type HINT domain-containing protein [Paenibacillus plantiphilus]CAH1217420.1 hypothetical protein PAECIP111893_04275 [Paenibacillus plantiphilus]